MEEPTTVPADNASQPKKSSTGFLDLPAELRNDIYRLAFCTDQEEFKYGNHMALKTTKDALSDTHRVSLHRIYRPDITFPLVPGFLASCRQIHAEAGSILYGENAFHMSSTRLLNTIARAPSFISQVEVLYLELDDDEMSAFVCPMGTCDDFDVPQNLTGFEALPKIYRPEHLRRHVPDTVRSLEALEKVPKLRSLVIVGDVDVRPEYGADSEATAQIIAEYLRSIIKSIMDRLDLKVSEVLELKFNAKATILRHCCGRRRRGQHQRLTKLQDLIYQLLETALESS